MTGRASHVWLVAASLALVSLVLIAPSILRGEVLSAHDIVQSRDAAAAVPETGSRPSQPENPLLFDPAYVFLPDLREIRRQLWEGDFPTWTSGIGAGRPLWASLQHGATFPLTWVAFVLPLERSLALLLALKVLLAALGTFLLARTFGRSSSGATLSALAYSLSPYFVAWLQHPHVNAYALLPWCLLACKAVIARPDAARVAAAALAIGLTLLSGHPPSSIIVLLTAGAFAVFEVLRSRRGMGRAWTLVPLGIAGGLGLAVAAVALVPFYEILRLTEDYERGGGGAARDILGSLVVPEWWGRPEWGLDEGPSNFAERTLYFGAIPLLLAVIGVALRRSPTQLFFVGALVLSLLLSLDIPYVAPAIREIPFATAININRFVVIATFAGALLAGFGFDAILERRPAVRWWALIAGLIVVIAPLSIAGATGNLNGFTWETFEGAFGASAADTLAEARSFSGLRWLLLSLWFIAGLRLIRSHTTVWAAGALMLTCLELLIPAAGYHTFMDEAKARPTASASIAALQRTPNAQRSVGWGLVGPNTSLDFGLRDPRAHDHPPVDRYSRLWQALAGGSPVRTELAPSSPQKEKLLALFSVRRFLSKRGERIPSGLRTVAEPEPGLLLSNFPDAFPRAWVAHGARSSPSLDESIEKVRAAVGPTLRERPVIEGARDAVPAVPSIPARVLREQSDEVVIRATAQAPGHLILSDTFFPGWTAEVDGRRAPILPANGAFRAVPVARGVHDIRFEYRPESVRAGMAVSAIAALVLMLLFGFGARRLPQPVVAMAAMRKAALDLDGKSLLLASRAAARRFYTSSSIAFTRMADRSVTTVLREARAPEAEDVAPAPAPPIQRFDRRALALLLFLPLAGAAIGAATDPLPERRFRAETVVAVHGDASASDARAGQWRAFAAALETPEVLRTARAAANLTWPLDEVRESVSAEGSAGSGLVRVRATGESQPAADALANAAATQAVAVLRRSAQTNLVRTTTASTFDFETTVEGWNRAAPRFTFVPAEVRRSTEDAHEGRGALQVRCRVRTPGCGPSIDLSRTFAAGVAYTGRLFARADEPVRLRLVLGGDARDVAVGSTILIRDEWEPLTVTWTPRRSFGAADLAVQVMEGEPAEFAIDTAVVRDPRDLEIDPALENQAEAESARVRVERAAREDRYTVITPAQPVEQIEGSTVGSGVYGGLLGLIAAVAALAGVALARKRQAHGEDEPHS